MSRSFKVGNRTYFIEYNYMFNAPQQRNDWLKNMNKIKCLKSPSYYILVYVLRIIQSFQKNFSQFF